MLVEDNRSGLLCSSTVCRYGLALGLGAASLLIAEGLRFFLSGFAPYLILFPAIAVAATYCGAWPSSLAAAVSVIGLKYWFVTPLHSLVVPKRDLLTSAIVLCSLATVITLAESMRRANGSLRKARGYLETRVDERTSQLNDANASLSELTARLLQLQDDERRRLARDLHDGFGQLLAGLTMNLDTIQADIEHVLKAATLVNDCRQLAQDASTSVRTLSYLLHPPLLDEGGLSSALPWLIQGFTERSKVDVDLELPSDMGRLASDVETTIFRLVQESLTNIHRHSGSSTAGIHLSVSQTEVCVTISDHGKGIPPNRQLEMQGRGTPGVGIRGMRERVRQLGGSLEINSPGVGKGTSVIARLPLSVPLAYRISA